MEFASILSVWHTQVFWGTVLLLCCCSFLPRTTFVNVLMICMIKGGHQLAFCSLRTRNRWSRDPRQCWGAHSYLDPGVLHHNHWKQTEVLFISLCLHLCLSIPHFVGQGKIKYGFQTWGLVCSDLQGLPGHAETSPWFASSPFPVSWSGVLRSMGWGNLLFLSAALASI